MMTKQAPTDIRALYREPVVRNYLFAALAGLALVFVVLFQQGSLEGGVLVVLVGAAGFLTRSAAAPPFVILLTAYLHVYPYGVPDYLIPRPYAITESRFRVIDMMLTAGVLVYLAAHYRLLGLTQRAVPAELPGSGKKGEPPVLRPPGLVPADEIRRLLWTAAGAVLIGQVVWLVVTSVRVVPGSVFPLAFGSAPSGISPPAQRFMVGTGMIAAVVLLGRLVFGYWRLRVMRPDEAAMTLQEAGWDEQRRELVRVEKWRLRGKERVSRDRRSGR